MGGHRKPGRHTRLRAIGAGLAFLALAASVAACGESSSSDSNQKAGTYEVTVTKSEFPTDQQLGQTSLLRIGIRNTGEKTVPAVAVTVSIAGKEGQTSSLPFGIHDPQPELAQPDRPVWVLAEGSPRIAGTHNPTVAGNVKNPGGASSSSPKTFDFGSLKPGDTVEGIWKLSAVKARPLHPALRSRSRPQRRSQGEDRRRSQARWLLRRADRREAAEHHGHRLGPDRRNRQAEEGDQVASWG